MIYIAPKKLQLHPFFLVHFEKVVERGGGVKPMPILDVKTTKLSASRPLKLGDVPNIGVSALISLLLQR